MRFYDVRLVGRTPLLLHHDNIEWADEMERWSANPDNKNVSRAGDDRTPAWRYIGCFYGRDTDDYIGIDSECIARCMMLGGAQIKVPGKGKKTFKAQTQSGMRIEGLCIPIEVNGKVIEWRDVEALIGEGDLLTHKTFAHEHGYRLNIRRAAINRGASKHVRVRPVFDEWALSFQICVMDDLITETVLLQILTYAGNYCGLGDWRPGGKTPGSFGMFEVESMKQIKAAA